MCGYVIDFPVSNAKPCYILAPIGFAVQFLFRGDVGVTDFFCHIAGICGCGGIPIREEMLSATIVYSSVDIPRSDKIFYESLLVTGSGQGFDIVNEGEAIHLTKVSNENFGSR